MANEENNVNDNEIMDNNEENEKMNNER